MSGSRIGFACSIASGHTLRRPLRWQDWLSTEGQFRFPINSGDALVTEGKWDTADATLAGMRPLLLNTTFHFLLLLFLISICTTYFDRRRRIVITFNSVVKILVSRWVLIFLLCGTSINLGLRITAVYINPRDYLQDYIAATRFVGAKSLYPPDLPALAAGAASTPFPGDDLLRSVSILDSEFAKIRENAPGNAHPPLNALLLALPAMVLGPRGSYLFIFLVLSLLLVLLVRSIAAELYGAGPPGLLTGILVLLFGWYPVVASLRSGQSGIVIAILCLMSWLFLRKGRDGWAGVPIGIAACLHLFPLFITGYFLLRARRAFFASVLTICGIVFLTTLMTYQTVYFEWLSAASVISDAFVPLRSNYSLVGVITLLLKDLGLPYSHRLIAVMLGLSLFCLLAVVLWPWRHNFQVARGIDIEFAAFLTASLVVSPITWERYFPILLLPLAVLVYYERGRARIWAVPLLLGMICALSIPSQVVESVFYVYLRETSGVWVAWLVTNLPPLSVVALMVWLLYLARTQEDRPHSCSGEA